jgi:hypothetical protein
MYTVYTWLAAGCKRGGMMAVMENPGDGVHWASMVKAKSDKGCQMKC